MGCESSSAGVYQYNDDNAVKRNIKTGFDDKQRAKLLQAIEWNDPSDFAVASDQFNIPILAQLSEKGLFWMAHHFCCRWNAHKVLDYVLKTAYLEDPKNYVKFVNQPTIQGFTCLHLCAIWNAPQCLQLLLKFGGLNLQAKDKTQATPYLTAINYKRNDMKNNFKEYEEMGIRFLIVQHQKLTSGDILALQTVDTEGPKKKQQFNPKLNGGLKSAIGGVFMQTEQQKQLQAQKKKIQAEKQAIRQQLKKIQEQEGKKQKQKVKVAEQQKKKIKQRQVQQKQQQLIQQLAQKQEQLSKLKNNLSKIEKQKQQSLINQEKKKSEEFLLKNQAQLQQKLSQKKSIIEQQRQSVMKSRIQRGPKTERAIDIKQEIFGVLPSELQKIYDDAKRAGIFVDPDFPQTQDSIGNTPKAKKFINDLAWLRPKQFLNGEYSLFDGIDPSDIKQGSLGVCYMLATLATLAQSPQRIKDLFVFYDKALGFYVIKLLIHGQIKYIPVDDAIPCSKNTKSPLFAKPNGKQLWVCLVQKTWAKCIGNYMKAESMTPNHLMQDLTTCPSFGAWFKDKTQKTKDIDTHIKMGNIVVLTTLNDRKIEGIVNDHAYSLLNVYQHQGKNIYKLRNPWGKFEWKGQYRDDSSFWTEQNKKKFEFAVDADDGMFFLSQAQLLQAFVFYSISITKINNKYSFVPMKTKKDQSRFYTFELDEDQEINLRYVQKFNRMLDDPDYKYSPVAFEVGKIQQTGEVTFLTEGDNSCFWGGKSVHADPEILKKYSKGKYFVRIAPQWVNEAKYNTGVFSVFSMKQLEITQLSNQEGQTYWIELLKNFALKKATPTVKSNMQYIMTWMRAQMICYSYGKQSETSQKFEAKWTFDPSKFTNCTFGMNHIQGTNDVKYSMGKGKKNANIGTLKRLVIYQSCNSGSVLISATPI